MDDELSMREFFNIMLSAEGYEVHCVESGSGAVSLAQKEQFDLVISDIRMPGMDGIEVLKRIKALTPDAVVIMVSAYATAETAVRAMKEGAYDYIPKPFNVDEIKLIIQKALEKKNLQEENDRLRQELQKHNRYGGLIGNSSTMQNLQELIGKVAETRSNVLICGESGTGKELVARAVHARSSRGNNRFVAVNCGGIPDTLIESELFGHRKGSFTGAVSDQKGLFAAADGGSLFLDEVGELPPALQVKLLRAIQERVFRPVGGTEDISVDIRLISATNKDLETAIDNGSFREDLFYRLNVIQIKVPPLRERKEDIPLLAQHFVQKYNKESGKQLTKLSSEALKVLMQYDFPGNVRELENIIERSIALVSSATIQTSDLYINNGHKKHQDSPAVDIPDDGFDLEGYIAKTERDILLRALQASKGAKQKAASLLGLTFRSFRHRLTKYGL
ncbi:MAG: sigma-54 dependent transcriptional regulator [Pseudomonadota bacterium]